MTPPRGRWREALHARRYTHLLVVLVGFALFSALIGELPVHSWIPLDMGLLAVLMMAVFTAGERRVGVRGVVVLVALLAAANLGLRASGSGWGWWTAVGLLVVFLWVATLILLADVLGNARLPLAERIRGAICVYFLLGLSWAVSYGALAALRPGAIAGLSAEVGGISQDLLYYSFVTLTTLGYGDLTPVSDLARTLSWLEAFTGQMYVAITIARLVSQREGKN